MIAGMNPEAPRTLLIAFALSVLSGLVVTGHAVSEVLDERITARLLGGLFVLLVISMLPAALAWFATKGYLLAYVLLGISTALTMLREVPTLPDMPGLLLVPLTLLILGCLLLPVSIRWIRQQRP